MFSPDVRFEGFSSADWTRLLGLFSPVRSKPAEDPASARGGVVAVQSEGKLEKLLHTHVGRLRLSDVEGEWPIGAEALAARHRASWAIVLERGSLESVMDRFAGRSRRGDDLIDQVLTLVSLIRDELIAGQIEVWPVRLRGVPIPTRAMVLRTLDAVCPPDRSIVVGVFEGGELHTAVVLRRGAMLIEAIVGPEQLRAEMGILSGDWRRDHRHLVSAAEDRFGSVALGFFSELTTLRALEVDSAPGAWSKAVAVRDVILSPAPPALAVPIGIDAGLAAYGAVRGWLARNPVASEWIPSAQTVGNIGRALLGSETGFDPLGILRKLLTR